MFSGRVIFLYHLPSDAVMPDCRQGRTSSGPREREWRRLDGGQVLIVGRRLC